MLLMHIQQEKDLLEGKNILINLKLLTDGIITKNESARFLKLVQNLRKLKAKDLKGLNVEVMPKVKK